MSEAQTLKTLIHEISHSLTDDKENPGIAVENPTERTRSTKEVTAESVAYTVCQRFGIDTSDYSFGYIAGWSSGKDMKELKDSMDLIRRTASEVINGVEDNLKMLAIERFAHEAMNVEKEPAEPAGRTFEIWQLKDTPENHKIMFENMEYMYQNDISVDRENYEIMVAMQIIRFICSVVILLSLLSLRFTSGQSDPKFSIYKKSGPLPVFRIINRS